MQGASNTAVQVSPSLNDSDASSLYDVVVSNSKNEGGRFLVVNSSGTVVADAFSALNGSRLTHREVNDIVYGFNSSSYGFHQIYDETTGEPIWALYCVSAIVNNGRILGAVVYSASIQDVITATDRLQVQTIWIFGVSCGIIILLSMFSTGYITKPVKALTSAALKVSSGDLTQRAHIKGKGEIAELGQTFNMMCERLQNIDTQRSEFVSDVSHELKTPLASMKILVESLLYQDHVPEELYQEFLGDINNEIDRLNSLINDLLLMSKMENDTIALNIEKESLRGVLQKCINALLPIATRKGVEITFLPGADVELECDSLKLRQALNNLIENAIKYSKDNGLVRIVARRAGGEAVVSIEDNGVGMPKEHLPRIFERFYRVDKARARETGGSGLGLYIVSRIVLMHAGRIEVESREGVGSKFTVHLPLLQRKTLELKENEDA